MGQAIRDIFNCPSLADAEAMVGRVAQRFATENPPWVKWLEDNIGEGFTVYRFARSAHRRIRHRQPTGTGEQGGPAPHPGGRDLPQRSLGLEIDLGRVGGDSRGVVNRPAVSEPGRLEYHGETWFPDQLQKIGCVIASRRAPPRGSGPPTRKPSSASPARFPFRPRVQGSHNNKA